MNLVRIMDSYEILVLDTRVRFFFLVKNRARALEAPRS